MTFATAIITAVVLLVLSVILFFAGIVRKNLSVFIWSVALFLASLGVGAYGVFVVARQAAAEASTQK
ncbi:MAG: hypothetical protein V4649_16230 [Bacteroidota bacterium]